MVGQPILNPNPFRREEENVDAAKRPAYCAGHW
jgi:hypothetical protein